MPRSAIPVIAPLRTGTGATPPATVGDATNNHTLANDGRTLIVAKNTGSTVARTVTVHLDRLVDGQAAANKTYAIPQSQTRLLGAFPVGDYGGSVLVDIDNVELQLYAINIP